MSAPEDLLRDHIFIRQLQAMIEKCHILLFRGKDVPFSDLVKIVNIIEQFVDEFHHGKEETSYFPETEQKDDYSGEVRRFVIEHEFGRRIANKLNYHLKELIHGKDAREPLARYLKTYSVFILDHTSKEDRFFTDIKENHSLSEKEEKDLKKAI